MSPEELLLPRRRAALLRVLGVATGLGVAIPPLRAQGQVLRVGPRQAVRSLASAAQHARDGMRVEVEAGDYVADVAVWPQSDLSLKAVGGRVRLIAAGASAQGKAIFVTSGERVSIEGFDFQGTEVPDLNGAGIRLERGSLSLRDCSFSANECGVLTSNHPEARLRVENCEFGSILARDGKNHNLYVGRIAELSVTGSYFHHGQLGHLLKSRAAVSHILYNRLSDEVGGRASYELEFPNGGVAVVVGNIIQQSAQTQNPYMVSYGSEGLGPNRHELYLINNTLVDNRPSGGIYLSVAAGPVRVRAINNLLVGNSRFASEPSWDSRANHLVDWDAFVMAARENYALKPGSPLRGTAVDPGTGPDGQPLRPTRQYQHPRNSVALPGPALHPGAVQLP